MKGTENDKLAEKTYNAFITNKALSYFPDTVQLANMMNVNHGLDNKLQYSFLINIVRPGKRYSKWVKKDKAKQQLKQKNKKWSPKEVISKELK